MQEQQNCSHKTWHIRIEIVSNGSSKIGFVSLLRKKLFLLFYIVLFGVTIYWVGGKNSVVRNEKRIVFSKSRYVNSNSVITLFQLVWVFLNVLFDIPNISMTFYLEIVKKNLKLVVTVKKGYHLFEIWYWRIVWIILYTYYSLHKSVQLN